MPRQTFTALNTTFAIEDEYEFVEELGEGSAGYVIAVKHKASGAGCAIKKMANVDTKKIFTKRCLREIKLLRHFNHPNILSLYDLDIVFQANGTFKEVYFYEELMEVNLDEILRSGQLLSDLHNQSITYQLLKGLQHIHAAGVLHCDIRPGNMLVNAHCEVRVCDFGQARPRIRPGDSANHTVGQGFNFMSEYVSRRAVPRRWYRAPELILSFMNPDTAIDMWSAGCTLAELLSGQPLFQGRDYVHQLNSILKTLGTPSPETISHVGSARAQEYMRSLPATQPIPFAQLFPNANPLALDLLSKMLAFDPHRRITVDDALRDPYFQIWSEVDADDGDILMDVEEEKQFDFSFEQDEQMEAVQARIVDEVKSFREQVRARGRSSEWQTTNKLPMPTREVVMNTPIQEHFQGGFHDDQMMLSPDGSSPIIDDPPGEFERGIEGHR